MSVKPGLRIVYGVDELPARLANASARIRSAMMFSRYNVHGQISDFDFQTFLGAGLDPKKFERWAIVTEDQDMEFQKIEIEKGASVDEVQDKLSPESITQTEVISFKDLPKEFQDMYMGMPPVVADYFVYEIPA